TRRVELARTRRRFERALFVLHPRALAARARFSRHSGRRLPLLARGARDASAIRVPRRLCVSRARGVARAHRAALGRQSRPQRPGMRVGGGLARWVRRGGGLHLLRSAELVRRYAVVSTVAGTWRAMARRSRARWWARRVHQGRHRRAESARVRQERE